MTDSPQQLTQNAPTQQNRWQACAFDSYCLWATLSTSLVSNMYGLHF